MLSQIKPRTELLLRSIAKPFVGLNPNLITLLGMIPPVLFFVLIVKYQYVWALVALAGSAIDTLDGAVARMSNRVTLFGAVLDSSVDRVSDLFYISAFGFAGIVRWEIIIPTIGAAYMISYVRSRAELAGKGSFKLDVGLMERTERVLMIFLAVIVMVFWPDTYVFSFNLTEIVFIVLLVLSTITIFQRLYFAYQKLSQKK